MCGKGILWCDIGGLIWRILSPVGESLSGGQAPESDSTTRRKRVPQLSKNLIECSSDCALEELLFQ